MRATQYRFSKISPDTSLVVALVQTQVLERFPGGFGSLCYYCIEGQQLIDTHIRPGHHCGERSSVGLDQ
jgi:hypothetical protein